MCLGVDGERVFEEDGVGLLDFFLDDEEVEFVPGVIKGSHCVCVCWSVCFGLSWELVALLVG